MSTIGEYKQLTSFTNESAGTAEWCMAEKSGKQYFVKKFQSPVYPSRDLGLPEKKYKTRVDRFHAAIKARNDMYQKLRENDEFGVFIIPEEVINYQYHICTVADYVIGNVKPEEIFKLSEWQRVVLMRTLTLALMGVHRAGMVHSDMKPDNVIIYQNETNGSCALKLIDFDGSFFESDPPEDVTGDPTYFSPEAYAMTSTPGIRLDHRIDIFALGIILHYFWTGKLPEKDSDLTIGQAALRGKLIRLDPSIPDTLQTIIRRALESNPDKRIKADEIYQKLGDLLSAYPVKIINLQEARKPEPKVSKPAPDSGSRRPAAEKKTPTSRPIESLPVMCYDTGGHLLRTSKIDVEHGQSKTVRADYIPDYHIISSDSVTVSVDKDGYPSLIQIRFTYEKNTKTKEKDSSGWIIFWWIVGLIVLCYLLTKM